MENLSSKEYITIGTPILTKELFRNVLIPLNNYSFKPSGGLYASEHINNYYTISPWFKYLKHTEGIASYKNIFQSVIFTLKDTAKILYIDTEEKLLEIADKYPSYHNNLIHHSIVNKNNTIFSFESLSEEYDGIYVKIHNFYNNIGTVVFDTWQVDTLLLFNLDCIKEFRTAPITIEENEKYFIPKIEEKNIGTSKKIDEESYEHKIILKSAELIFSTLIDKYKNYFDYDEYLNIITKNIGQLIQILKQKHDKEINKILVYLHSQNINISKDQLIENIALNYLSIYLKKDKQRIKSLKKAKEQNTKHYYIY